MNLLYINKIMLLSFVHYCIFTSKQSEVLVKLNSELFYFIEKIKFYIEHVLTMFILKCYSPMN